MKIVPRQWMKHCLSALTVFLLAACGSSSVKPVAPPIGDFKVQQEVKLLWSLQLPAANQLNQTLPVVGQRTAVTASTGQVMVVDLAQGQLIWQADAGKKLQTGAGFDGDSVAVISASNELMVFQDGKQVWQKRLTAQSFTNPVVAGNRVFVLLADRSVSAYDKFDGQRLWVQQRNGEPLVLKQNGVLLTFENTLVAGLGGRLLALNPDSGQVLWDIGMANPRGLNGSASRVNNSVCVRAFQAQLGCVNMARGSMMWNRSSVGNRGLGGDATTLVGTESNGVVRAWSRSNGDRMWDTDRLKYRDLSQPLWTDKGIVLGDEAGFIYLLSGKDGSLLNRLQTPASGFASAPTAVTGSSFVALARNGLLLSYQLP